MKRLLLLALLSAPIVAMEEEPVTPKQPLPLEQMVDLEAEAFELARRKSNIEGLCVNYKSALKFAPKADKEKIKALKQEIKKANAEIKLINKLIKQQGK